MSRVNLATHSIMPLLARLVLGAALFFAGWHNCFQTIPMTQDQIEVLEGVKVVPVAWTPPSPPANSPKEVDTPDSPAGDAEAEASPVPAWIHSRGVKRAGAELIAWRLRESGFGEWSEPLAWAVSVLQLVGGGFLFLGLLTRFWALIVAVVFGLAIWLGPIEQAGMFDRSPFGWYAQTAAFSDLFLLASGVVLSIGLVFTGSGWLGVDCLLRGGVNTQEPDTGTGVRAKAASSE